MTPANWPATATDLLAAPPEYAGAGIAESVAGALIENA